jgi:hypothetical protein
MISLRKTVIRTCGTCLLFTTLLGARPAGPPSLAGTWELDLPKSDFGSIQRPSCTITRTITQQGSTEVDVSDQMKRPALVEMVAGPNGTTVSGTTVQPGKTEVEVVTLFTDGRHSSITTTRASFSAVAVWKGSSLLVTLYGTHPNESDDGTKNESTFNEQQVWTLSNNGNTLQIKETTNSDQNSNTVTYIFDRT